MSDQLQANGTPLSMGDITITAHGFSGVVERSEPRQPGSRAVTDGPSKLVKAIPESYLQEQATLTIDDQQIVETERDRGTRQRGDQPEPSLELEVRDPGAGFGQVVLSIDVDGVLSWHMPEPVGLQHAATRASKTNHFQLRVRRPSARPDGQRGVLGWIGKRVLKVFVFKVLDNALGAIGEHLVTRWERKHRPPVLHVVTKKYLSGESPEWHPDSWDLLASGHSLLLLHGTMSRARSGFGSEQAPVLKDLISMYHGRVFAFDHPTLSVSPLVNARQFAQLLPKRRTFRISILAHSRGGLVGRVLCEQPGLAGLPDGRLRVERLVMVATPNSGTPLADLNNIGTLIDTLTNILEHAPDNVLTDTLEVLLTLVQQIAVGVSRNLDGLAAMRPDSEFLKSINSARPSTMVRYRAISADFEPNQDGSLAAFARDFLADRIFEKAPNDLVVPTGGVSKWYGHHVPSHDSLELPATAAVSHSGYWSHPEAQEALKRWLMPNA